MMRGREGTTKTKGVPQRGRGTGRGRNKKPRGTTNQKAMREIGHDEEEDDDEEEDGENEVEEEEENKTVDGKQGSGVGGGEDGTNERDGRGGSRARGDEGRKRKRDDAVVGKATTISRFDRLRLRCQANGSEDSFLIVSSTACLAASTRNCNNECSDIPISLRYNMHCF